MRYKLLKTFAKVSVVALSIVYLIRIVPIGEAFFILGKLRIRDLLSILVIVLATIIISAYILKILSSEYSEIPLNTAFKLLIINMALNSFIPSKAGSMITMPYLFDKYTNISKPEGAGIQGAYLSLIAAIISLTTLAGLTLIHRILPFTFIIVLFTSACVYLTIPISAIVVTYHGDNKYLEYIPVDINVEFLFSTTVFYSLLLTILYIVLLSGIRFAILGFSFGSILPLYLYLFVPVLIYAVSVLPISFGGLGLAEATGTGVLVGLGIPPSIAAAIVLADRTLSFYLPVTIAYIYANYIFIRGGNDLAYENNAD